MSRFHVRIGQGVAVAALLSGVLAGCSGEHTETVRIYAAASLQEPFEALGEQFEAEHDGVDLQFNFAGSSDLAAQIQNGAPADVFASADDVSMQRLVDEGLAAGRPEVFATNTLTIAVAPGNPAGVTSLTDLGRPDVDLVVCAPQVPCGAATERLEQAEGLAWSPRSEELSVTDVLNKVAAGEADAGLVYVSDVHRAADRVAQVVIDADQTPNRYPIVTVAEGQHPDHAAAFLALVLSPAGRAALTDAGFELP